MNLITFLAESPAPAISLVPQNPTMDSMSVGQFGAGGLALVLVSYLVFLIKKGGSTKYFKLNPEWAFALALSAVTFCTAAGGSWDTIPNMIRPLLGNIATSAQLGAGMGAIATVLTGFFLFRNHSNFRSAIVGGLCGITYSATGGLWLWPAALVTMAAKTMGLT